MFGEALCDVTCLKELRLFSCCIGDSGCRALMKGLAKRTAPLLQLNLGSNEIGGEGLLGLIEALLQENHQSSLELSLAMSRITDRGALKLSKALEHNTVLKHLDLFWNNAIVDAGRRALTFAMERNHVVKHLSLDYDHSFLTKRMNFLALCNKLHLHHTLRGNGGRSVGQDHPCSLELSSQPGE
mmetsp:Transcript_12747/g.29646  ORF Transcript_12747/g.29646 Transcript_12747/m.29646 type:complete len:184 (+) Transcript_12747:200-751(+)